MSRIRDTLVTMVERLEQVGYRLAYPDAAWQKPCPVSAPHVEQLERSNKPLPLSLRTCT